MYSNLKLRIWKLGFRQNRLARELDVDEAMFSRVVNGYKEPGPELKMHIAKILDCDPEWLFARDEEPFASKPGDRNRASGQPGQRKC